ncbi:mechanosensitive ion channel protein MscS [Enterococcus saigonensis]|uniref:Mechanosensitive ion channel protein MscS n=1 Tax=Enterococcus saigonensis TaxID=1805431 RepID=A0A679IPR2_9ENTE|nr:mechanosensitive ion channel family protein [Enterococcus saigonensis]BCA85854.1 mechanosensitive ion channel protein MscS [Enterococcus saigonensis]
MLYIAAQTTDSTGSAITEPAVRQLNAFQRWWGTINWENVTGLLISKGLMIIFLIILFSALLRLCDFLVERSYQSYQKRQKFSESRMNTLNTLIRNVIHYTLGFFFIYSLLSTLGVPVGSLLAGAGIAGLAIGLGAQGFMNDIITGFFIIMEQQIDVGDYIILSNLAIEGTVTSVGIRTLELRSANGTVHFIPNRNITTISNNSRSNMQVIVDVRIDPNEGLDKIKSAIKRANDKISKTYQAEIQTEPTIFGLVDLGNSNYAIRTTFYVLNGQQFKIKEDLLAAAIIELNADELTIPSTPILPAAK